MVLEKAFFRRLVLIMIAASFLGCEADPVQLDPEVSPLFAKPPKETNEFRLLGWYVEAATVLPEDQGLTADPAVNTEISDHLLDEFPEIDVDWAGYLGCPQGVVGCSKITLVMNGGKATAVYMGTYPVVARCGNEPGDPNCFEDTEIENHWRATLAGGTGIPPIPWGLIEPLFGEDDQGNPTFTFFWQGQRRTYATWEGGLEKVRGKLVPGTISVEHMGFYPNLYPFGQVDEFRVSPAFHLGNKYYFPAVSEEFVLDVCASVPVGTSCLASFKGEDELGQVTAEFTDISVTGDLLEFSVKATNGDPSNPNPQSFGRAMLTDPDGNRQMLNYATNQREGGVAATRYRVTIDPDICYTLDLAGLIVEEKGMESFVDDNKYVWDGNLPGIKVGSCSTS